MAGREDWVRMVALQAFKDSRGVFVRPGDDCYLHRLAARAAASSRRAMVAPDPVATVETKVLAEDGDGEEDDVDQSEGAYGADALVDGPPAFVQEFAAQYEPADPGTVHDIEAMSADSAIAMIRGAESVPAILRWWADEAASKQRVTVGRALAKRLEELARAEAPSE